MKTFEYERRTFLGDVEFRAAKNGTLVAAGYAARFNVLSQNLGGFVEVVTPGAFAKTIQEADVRALFNHDANYVLGRKGSGTLRLSEDSVGLAYEIDLPDTSLGRDLAALIERRDISASSFGFRKIEDAWGSTAEGFPLRTLRSVALRDVGPVTFPAYTSADVALRSLAEERRLDISVLISAAECNELAQYVTDPVDPEDAADGGTDEETEVEAPELGAVEGRVNHTLRHARAGAHLL